MRVAVIGFGMMGRQIAQVFAQHGSEVAVTDENPVAVKSGLDEVAHGPYGIESAVGKGQRTPAGRGKTLRKRRAAAETGGACKGANLAIEGGDGHLHVKQTRIATLEST